MEILLYLESPIWLTTIYQIFFKFLYLNAERHLLNGNRIYSVLFSNVFKYKRMLQLTYIIFDVLNSDNK